MRYRDEQAIKKIHEVAMEAERNNLPHGECSVKVEFPIFAGALIRKNVKAFIEHLAFRYDLDSHVSESKGFLDSTFYVTWEGDVRDVRDAKLRLAEYVQKLSSEYDEMTEAVEESQKQSDNVLPVLLGIAITIATFASIFALAHYLQ